MTNRIAITCGNCSREQETRPTAKGAARLPRGWKRVKGTVFCAACWKARYVLRAITLPIAGPADRDWKELQAVLDACWRRATTVANHATAELLRRDVVRTPDMEKLPPMERVYLYPGARAVCPEMDTASVVSILQAVERKYRAERYHVLWRRAKAPPSYRYPTPYPVHNRSWSASETDGGALLISVRLDGERRTIRLRTGPRFHRQRSAVRSLIAGDSLPGELAIYRRGGDVMAKLVMWMPRQHRDGRKGGGVLYVKSAPDSLLVYHVDGGPPRYLHADQVRRWVTAYRRRMDRLYDDTKAEKRPTKRKGRGIDEVRTAWGRKQRARLDSHTHEVSAIIASYAARQRVATVAYDDRDRSYLSRYPWHDLRTKLAYKLDERAVGFEVASGAVVGDDTTALDVG